MWTYEYDDRETVLSSWLRKKLIAEGVKKAECERCKLTTWMGDPAPLELDHIDSNHNNNRLENLQILCANCHGQKTKMTRRDGALDRELDDYYAAGSLYDEECEALSDL